MSAKSLYGLAAFFAAVPAYAWLRDSPAAALSFFLFLFPYVFLVLTQDMVRSEVDSGGLENVAFLRQDFRRYLLEKNAVIALFGGLVSLALFGILVTASCGSRSFSLLDFAQFGAGLFAGLYYTALAGFLSYLLKAGSNVLVIFLGQAALAVSFLLSAGSETGFLRNLSEGAFPDFPSLLKFSGLVALLPNTVVSRKFLPWTFEVAGLSLFFFWLQYRQAARLELKKQ